MVLAGKVGRMLPKRSCPLSCFLKDKVTWGKKGRLRVGEGEVIPGKANSAQDGSWAGLGVRLDFTLA